MRAAAAGAQRCVKILLAAGAAPSQEDDDTVAATVYAERARDKWDAAAVAITQRLWRHGLGEEKAACVLNAARRALQRARSALRAARRAAGAGQGVSREADAALGAKNAVVDATFDDHAAGHGRRHSVEIQAAFEARAAAALEDAGDARCMLRVEECAAALKAARFAVDEAQRDAALLATKRARLEVALDAKRAAHADNIGCLAQIEGALAMARGADVLCGVLYDRTRRALRRGAKGKG